MKDRRKKGWFPDAKDLDGGILVIGALSPLRRF
jgi:hypothetical protein